MNKLDLSEKTSEELVAEFEKIAIKQETSLDNEERSKFNRLYDDMEAVDGELKSRGLGARRLLVELYEHKNLQVRLKAATHTLAIEPERAKLILNAIRDSKIPPQYLDAGMLIRALEDGRWQPD